MLKKILAGLAVLIVAFLGFVATRPDTFHIERTGKIAAPAEVVFPFLNDFSVWTSWSPWDKLDPSMKKTLSSPPAGVGATYAWVGNDKVGEGKMTITESKQNEKVVYKLEFIKPWEATNTTTIAEKAEGDGVVVTWSMDGTNGFGAKMASVFMDMDKMVGGDFEKGLKNMKELAEARAKEVVAANAAAVAVPAAGAAAAAAPAAVPATPAPAETAAAQAKKK